MPVLRLGIVETKAQIAALAGPGELLKHVAVERRGVDDVVGADLGREEREAVVMFRGDDQVLHAGVLGEPHPGVGVELHRVEPRGELLVFTHGDLCPVHDPFANAGHGPALPLAGGNGVEAPVNEEAELGLMKPGQALRAGGVGGRRLGRSISGGDSHGH